MNTTLLKSFYTYLWLREDGTPYYVGKGMGERALRKGSPPIERIIFQDWSSEAEALEAERFLIACYGRKDIGTGILRNMTDGGDGTAGRKLSAESRQKIRAANVGKIWSEDVCRKISKSLTGRKVSESARANMRRVKLGVKFPPSFGQKMRTALLGRQLSSEHRKNISRGRKTASHTIVRFTECATVSIGSVDGPQAKGEI